jgi:menaquinone-dependent protoporphyrinogen IX oxidase
MNIEYLHSSKFGNGVRVADEFKRQMVAKGVAVNVHHICEATPTALPSFDLYVFSSPGRMGKPIGRMRRFLKHVTLPAGTKYAVLTAGFSHEQDRERDGPRRSGDPRLGGNDRRRRDGPLPGRRVGD